MIGIYKITSPLNKVYIGQSWNIQDRFKKYKQLGCKTQLHLYNSFLKHGVENHSFEIIHELPIDITQEIIDRYEVFHWELYIDCGTQMLNIREPGKGGRISEETKKKISKANSVSQLGIRKGYKLSEETKEKIRIGNIGKRLSIEAREKISKSQTGSKRNLGRKFTEEHKRKLSDAKKSRLISSETKEKMKISATIAWKRRKLNVE